MIIMIIHSARFLRYEAPFPSFHSVPNIFLSFLGVSNDNPFPFSNNNFPSLLPLLFFPSINDVSSLLCSQHLYLPDGSTNSILHPITFPSLLIALYGSSIVYMVPFCPYGNMLFIMMIGISGSATEFMKAPKSLRVPTRTEVSAN